MTLAQGLALITVVRAGRPPRGDGRERRDVVRLDFKSAGTRSMTISAEPHALV